MDEDSVFLKNKKCKFRKLIMLLVVVFVFFALYLFSCPKNHSDIYIHVSSGESISSIATELKNKKGINNVSSFKFFMKAFGLGNHISLGDYLIKKGTPVWAVALQIGSGKHGIEPLKITFREGLTNEQIASILETKINNFNKSDFLLKTNGKQGYLFPDTYFIFPMDTTDEIIKKMSDNFQNKTKNLDNEISASGKTINDIVTMASIIEGEASGKGDANIISGILWKRLSLGMPLQIDIDKDTYDNKGLPDKPLNNPGIASIKAAIYPKESLYLYYIHDDSGVAHFSENFAEHKKNINKYLK